MTFLTNQTSTSTLDPTPAIEDAVAAFGRLPVDERLGLLWIIYQNLGSSLTQIPAGAARLFLTQGLLHRIKQMSPPEQLAAIGNLLTNSDTPITRQYGLFAPNTKLAFWYQLFEWMSQGEVAPPADGYKLSSPALGLLKAIASLDLNEQIAVVRLIADGMGVSPLSEMALTSDE
ncbi:MULTISPECIES: orange carotenoid protein N-terminal domain-containing protein [unclassified Coleofasciculus]|uniref:orange carotenoid protein N-terminal domain-containing protein n=1 Tax=unclassified Coleofasciculus TaxID=2692782 RepID=UPI0018830150|nr:MULTISPECIES: orange carotenoid protein N-terminal domain-containing protein [unclassified Coleofasciculus]MBE9150703.1 Orange carotenoid protein [Coleofasciculus sp. LEGE 07092]